MVDIDYSLLSIKSSNANFSIFFVFFDWGVIDNQIFVISLPIHDETFDLKSDGLPSDLDSLRHLVDYDFWIALKVLTVDCDQILCIGPFKSLRINDGQLSLLISLRIFNDFHWRKFIDEKVSLISSLFAHLLFYSRKVLRVKGKSEVVI